MNDRNYSRIFVNGIIYNGHYDERPELYDNDNSNEYIQVRYTFTITKPRYYLYISGTQVASQVKTSFVIRDNNGVNINIKSFHDQDGTSLVNRPECYEVDENENRVYLARDKGAPGFFIEIPVGIPLRSTNAPPIGSLSAYRVRNTIINDPEYQRSDPSFNVENILFPTDTDEVSENINGVNLYIDTYDKIGQQVHIVARTLYNSTIYDPELAIYVTDDVGNRVIYDLNQPEPQPEPEPEPEPEPNQNLNPNLNQNPNLNLNLNLNPNLNQNPNLNLNQSLNPNLNLNHNLNLNLNPNLN